MNREKKRKTFEKGYYKTHACRDAFTCKVCGRLCTPENAGSQHRNHCPNCLSSLHVDVEPGDRASDCGGIMEPVAVWVRRGDWNGWILEKPWESWWCWLSMQAPSMP